MRILFVLSSMPVGGLEVFTVNLAGELIKTKNDARILVFKEPGEIIKLLSADKIEIFSAARTGKLNFFFLNKAHKYIKDFKPDIILSLSAFTYFFIEVLQKIAGLHAPDIIAFHSLKPCNFKDKLTSKLFLFFSKLWKGHYLFVSDNQLALNVKYYNLSKKNSFVIHNAVDAEFFSPGEKNINSKSLNIIHVANIIPEKDQWTLIKSLEIIDKKFIDWKLIFVGKDKINLLNSFKDYLQQKNLLDKVTFIQGADRASVKNLLSSSDVFVLSSTMEVFPVSVLEAMSMGLPCILTDVGGCSEIVADGYNGYLVKPKDSQAIADKILSLSRNPGLLKQMSGNARKTILEKFNLNICADKYLKMFGEIMQNIN